MSVPTQGESYSKLIEHIRKAQEEAAMLSHLTGLNDDRALSHGWLAISENLKKMQSMITSLAMGRLQ